jgi:hypothetical protein
VQSYTRFIDVWPEQSWPAQVRLRKVKHPLLRKLGSIIFWIVWGSVAAFALVLVALSIQGSRG